MVWMQGILAVLGLGVTLKWFFGAHRDPEYRLGYWLHLGLVLIELVLAMLYGIQGEYFWMVVMVGLAGFWTWVWVTDPRGKARRDNVVRFFRKEKMV